MDGGKLFTMKKEPSGQQPVEAFFQKDVEPSAVVAAAEGVGASQADAAAKKKRGGKGVEPLAKKQKIVGDVTDKAAPVVIIEDHSSPEPSVVTAVTALTDLPPGDFPRETQQLSLAPGASVMHGSAEPKAFLRGITSVMDKAALSTYDDEALESKILRSSLTACVALGEHARRLEQWHLHKAEQDEKMKELILKNSDAVKQMAQLEENLRKATEGAEQRLKAVVEEAKLEAERVAAEASKKAAKEAESAKAEAVAKAREDVVAAFRAEGWMVEGQNEWVASVVKASVDDWVKGLGADWMAERGDSYYQGGEFFTQHLIYRRLARHFGVSLEQFDPSVYGLPPLQPDVRVPLPLGEERPVIHDSMMMGGDDDDIGEEVSSKAAEGADDEAANP
ncbi:unnamed protein product [Cuscuta europaea]|nr:unnamed protein product [Cuscuta europaea]